MLVIGLTGGIGSGKTTVANLFAKKGVTIIDTDQLSRDVTQPGKPALQEIAAKFGSVILLPDGTLNRAELRSIIFADDEKRLWLEQLLHPLIRDEMAQLCTHAQSPYCIAVIPLLFETTPNPLINRALVVDATPKLQIERTIARDKVSDEQINAILSTQISREKRLRLADDVIHNDGTVEDLIPQVEKLHQRYMDLAQNVARGC